MLNRREVLVGGAAAGAAAMSGCFSRRSQWGFLSEAEARTLAVLCDQIIPEDEWPSASEAGAVTYIDRQLTGPYRRHRKAYRTGLEEMEKMAQKHFGVEASEASGAQQLELAKGLEQERPEIFELVRRHTMQGYYGSPRHGGNKDAASWRMLGLAEPPLRGRAQYDFTAEPHS